MPETSPPAKPGDALQDVETPALLVDLDAFEANLRTMADRIAASGLRFRPHAKTHKCAAVAKRQMALGAVGVCCQKVSEAAALVQAGVPDVLVSNEVIDPPKLDRVARLAREARVSICVDSVQGTRALAEACRRNGVRMDVLVEIDVGGNRCGVLPGEPALALAEVVMTAPELRYAGLQAYHGRAQHVRDWRERQAAIAAVAAGAASTRDLLAKHGITTETITGGGTGSYTFEMASGVFTEVQAGSYVYMDADYGRNLDEQGEMRSPFRQSLFIWTQVMSAPGRGLGVVDAGLKAMSFDSGMPLVWGEQGMAYTRASDEHGVIDEKAGRALRLGEKLRLVPGHCDPAVALYDWTVAYRGERVEEVWNVDARGMLT